MPIDRANLTFPLWLYFAKRAGEEGRTWAAGFDKYASAMKLGNRALKFMRLHQVEEGYDLLQESKAMIDDHGEIPSSMNAVLRRYYYGVSAFYSYCIEDFEMASQQLTTALEAVVEAVSEAKCLLLLSLDCQEFYVHHARIAHKQGHLQEMQRWIDHARAMAANDEPLCRRRNGEAIFFSDFEGFLRAMEPFNEEEQDFARDFTGLGVRTTFIDSFLQRIAPPVEKTQVKYTQAEP